MTAGVMGTTHYRDILREKASATMEEIRAPGGLLSKFSLEVRTLDRSFLRILPNMNVNCLLKRKHFVSQFQQVK